MARYHSQRTTHTRKPITTDVLQRLLHTLQHCRLCCHHNVAMFRAALCLAFYGFLHGGEFTTPSYQAFDPRIHATVADIKFKNDSLDFYIKRSKTDQLGKGHTVTLQASDSSLCPVTLIKEYIGLRSCSKQKPLFTLCNGHPLSLTNFQAMLHKLLSSTGLPPQVYNTHSLRIGAATSAAQEGLPSHIIKHLGR